MRCRGRRKFQDYQHWLSVLQASYLITLLPPYYENIPKRLVKSPKLYFNDPGLACYLSTSRVLNS
nr:DUF4143 domain-containing protein [Prevotella scopos]